MFLVLLAYLSLFIIPGIAIFRLLNYEGGTILEKAFLIVPLSIFYNYLTYLALNYIGIPINQITLIASVFACLFTSILLKKPEFRRPQVCLPNNRQVAFIIILLFAIFLRAVVSFKNIFPFSTDMSHHIYYARNIIEFGNVPAYPDPTFVVGEHIFLSYVPIFSGTQILSYIPLLSLLLINILTILCLYQLSCQISKSTFTQNLTLFLFSFLFLLGNSQLNYVFGGVVGNVLGYYLIINALLLTIFVYIKKSSAAAVCLMANIMVLVYSHTISPVLFIFIFFLSMMISLFSNKTYLFNLAKKWSREKKIILMCLVVLVMFLLYTPHYITSEKSQTMIYNPISSNYFEPFLNLSENSLLKYSITGFSLLALVGLFLILRRKDLTIEKYLLFFWWTIPTFYLIQSHLLIISLPNYRVLNYIYYPTIFLAAYATGSAMSLIKKRLVPLILTLIIVFLMLHYPVINEEFSFPDYKNEELNKDAFLYLNKTLLPGENVFADHARSNIADQAIKNYIPFNNTVFFRDYWFRYEQGLDMDTWNMMESTENHLESYKERNITYIVLENNPKRYKQFENSTVFGNIFENEKIIIYKVNYPN